MKTCEKCKQEKDFTEFSKAQGRCKPCHRYAVKLSRKKHPKTRINNRALHVAKELEANRKYKKDNAALVNEVCARRRAAAKQATPSWANTFFMREVYELARLRTRITGQPWHVDHIVPLNSASVCGLHVETNLVVIPKLVNLRKSNKTWPGIG